MPKAFYRRKILDIGDSKGITIPKDIVYTYDLKTGDYITIILDSDIDDYFFFMDMKQNRDRDELWKLLQY